MHAHSIRWIEPMCQFCWSWWLKRKRSNLMNACTLSQMDRTHVSVLLTLVVKKKEIQSDKCMHTQSDGWNLCISFVGPGSYRKRDPNTCYWLICLNMLFSTTNQSLQQKKKYSIFMVHQSNLQSLWLKKKSVRWKQSLECGRTQQVFFYTRKRTQ